MGANRTVVITGASTGIGRAAALRLDREGFRVFAGVRREADAESLRKEGSPRLEPLLLDVTDRAAIEAAAKHVDAELGPAGLDGLVNNAGIGIGAPIEFLDLDELRRQLDVNVVAVVAVTQAFLPAIRRARGRIVNIGSIGGRLSQPLVGPYSASKFALEAIRSVLAMLEHQKRVAIPADAVARVIEHALTAARPKSRYRVGNDAKMQALLARFLPDRWRDALIVRFMKYPRTPGP